MSSYFWFRR